MNVLEQFGVIPIDFSALETVFGQYKSIPDKVARLKKSGQLIRLKKGLYILSPEIHKKRISKELIANHLYGPSYISFENALSFYKLIPERVYSIRCLTTKRSKKFKTPFGHFEYFSCEEEYFKIGINQEVYEGNYAFLIACPEKAVCDMITKTPRLRIQSVKAMRAFLEEDLRIDLSDIKNFNAGIIKECIKKGKKKNELVQLYKLLKI
jgi:predicted transcriptional regulator of viral defense system